MLKYNFQRIFKARGIDRPYTYFVKNGFSPNTATRLTKERPRSLPLDLVEQLCKLWQCTPNDLLEWAPDANDAAAADNNSLSALIRTNAVVNMKSVIDSLSMAQLEEINKLIVEKAGKK